MTTVLLMGIADIVIGLLGLSGIGLNVREEYKGTVLEKDYKKFAGKLNLMTGVPWVVFALVFGSYDIGSSAEIVILIMCAVPGLIYSIAGERKFKKLFKEIENEQ